MQSIVAERNLGAFVYVVTAAVIRLRHLRKRLQRSLSFVYAGIYPICAVISEVLLRMLCLQYCINEHLDIPVESVVSKMNFIKVKNEKSKKSLTHFYAKQRI